MLAGKGVIRAGIRAIRSNGGVIRAGNRAIRVGQDF